MGSFEYHHTSFSYTLQETGEEKFVGVPEQGGRDLISADPLSPGTVYTAGVTSDGTVGLYRLEVSLSSGTGKLKMAGGVAGAMKESVQRAFCVRPGEEGRPRHRARTGHIRPARRGHRPPWQSSRSRTRRCFLRRLLLGAPADSRQPCPSCARRHECPRQYQAVAFTHRAVAGCAGTTAPSAH